MRRALLLLLALAVPALVNAQTTTAGTIRFSPDDVIGTGSCDPAGTETVDVTWSIPVTSVIGGTYRVYASTRTPQTDDSTGLKLCDTSDILADGVHASQVGSNISASASTQTEKIRANNFLVATDLTCQDTQTQTIHVCVHFFPSGQTTPSASAVGALTLELTVPAKPINVTVDPGEKALRVSWDEGTGGAADTTYYKIQAKATDAAQDAETHFSGKITGTSGRIEGLKEGVEYQVTVIAFSSADNASEPSDPKPGTPVPVLDFWEGYEATGGREQGGCASGPAGAAGLLGAALALALHRRRK